MAKQYLDIEGLKTFLGKIQDYYKSTDVTDRVGYAVKAGALQTSQNFYITGDATSIANIPFDGSSDVHLVVSINEASTTRHGFMSISDKTKLDGIEDSADANIIEAIQVATSYTTVLNDNNEEENVPNYQQVNPVNKTVKINLSDYAKKSDIVSIFKFKGIVATTSLLPTLGVSTGDVYHVTENQGEYVYNISSENGWEPLGSIYDLSNYYTKAEIDDFIQDLVTPLSSTISNIVNGSITVGSATVADHVANSLSITPRTGTTITYNGSSSASIDLSSLALDSEKADKVTVAAGREISTIASINPTGNLADTSINVSVLSGGSITNGNNSFVTGDQVYDYVESQFGDGIVTYEFNDGTNGSFSYREVTGGNAGNYQTIDTGADANIIESVKVDGTTLTVESKSVNILSSSLAKGIIATDSVSTTSTYYGTTETVSKPVSGKTVYEAFSGNNFITALTTAQIEAAFSSATSTTV